MVEVFRGVIVILTGATRLGFRAVAVQIALRRGVHGSDGRESGEEK